MIRIPFEQILEKIKAASSLSDDELNHRIQEKMDQLSGLISKEGAAHIIANELGVKLLEQSSGRLKVKNTLPGMRNVEILAKVQDIYEVRQFQKEDRAGKVGSCLIEDDTQRIRLVLWGGMADQLQGLEKGDIIKISGGYVKDNNGRRELHLGEKGILVKNPPGEEVIVKTSTILRKQIVDVKEQDENIELLGTVVQVFDIYFFELCPRCQKRVRQRLTNRHEDEKGEQKAEQIFACDYHGDVAPVYSCVMNVYLDDGSGTMRTVFFRQQIEKLLGKTNEQTMHYRDHPQEFEAAKQEILGKLVKVAGRVNKNIMFDRLEFVAGEVDNNPDPMKEIARLKAEHQDGAKMEHIMEKVIMDAPKDMVQEEIILSPTPSAYPKASETEYTVVSRTPDKQGLIDEVENELVKDEEDVQ